MILINCPARHRRENRTEEFDNSENLGKHETRAQGSLQLAANYKELENLPRNSAGWAAQRIVVFLSRFISLQMEKDVNLVGCATACTD